MNDTFEPVWAKLNIEQGVFDKIISDEVARTAICDRLLHCLYNVPEMQETAAAVLQYVADKTESDLARHGTVGVIVISDGKILVGTRAEGHENPGWLCGPGGHVEEGESFEDAAVRETEEEFGIVPNELIIIGECGEGTGRRYLCMDYEGDIECCDGEMTSPTFVSLEELADRKEDLFQPFAYSLDMLAEEIGLELDEPFYREDGGEGSGNFGHAGRPGEIGGSASGGGGDSAATAGRKQKKPAKDVIKELTPKKSYTRKRDYRDALKHASEARKKAKEAGKRKDELVTKLNQTCPKKPRDEWDDWDKMCARIGEPPRKMNPEGEKILDEIKTVDNERLSADKELSDANDEVRFIKSSARQEQVKTWDENRPELVPAAQERYEGFSLDTTGTSWGDEQLEKAKSGSKNAVVCEMSPEEYLKRCAYDVFADGTIESTMQGVTPSNVDKYAEKMAGGEAFDMPWLNFDPLRGNGQEGRHRALAAQALGIEKIPVLVVGHDKEQIEHEHSVQEHEYNRHKIEREQKKWENEHPGWDDFDIELDSAEETAEPDRISRLRTNALKILSFIVGADGHIDGGPGSGNWGHAGRPGEIGGSAKGTGSASNRIQKRNGTFTSYAKRRSKLSKPHTLTKTEVEKCPAGSVIIGAKIKLKKAESGNKYVDTKTGKEYTFKEVASMKGEHRLIMPKKSGTDTQSESGKVNTKASKLHTVTQEDLDSIKTMPKGTKINIKYNAGANAEYTSNGDGTFNSVDFEGHAWSTPVPAEAVAKTLKVNSHLLKISITNGNKTGGENESSNSEGVKPSSGGAGNEKSGQGKTESGTDKYKITGDYDKHVETLKAMPKGTKITIDSDGFIFGYTAQGGNSFIDMNGNMESLGTVAYMVKLAMNPEESSNTTITVSEPAGNKKSGQGKAESGTDSFHPITENDIEFIKTMQPGGKIEIRTAHAIKTYWKGENGNFGWLDNEGKFHETETQNEVLNSVKTHAEKGHQIKVTDGSQSSDNGNGGKKKKSGPPEGFHPLSQKDLSLLTKLPKGVKMCLSIDNVGTHTFVSKGNGMYDWEGVGISMNSQELYQQISGDGNAILGVRLEKKDGTEFKPRKRKVNAETVFSPGEEAFAAGRKASAIETHDPTVADDLYRDEVGKIWQNLDYDTKEAFAEYTGSGYRKINAGLRDTHGESLKTVGSKIRDRISRITDTIAKCVFKKDTIIPRLTGYKAANDLFALDRGFIENATNEELQALVGRTGTDKGFMSCGSTMGKGASSGDVTFKIFCPKGTVGMYVEPFSTCGYGDKINWDAAFDGKSKQSSFSYEQETILQRGTTLRITGIQKKGKHVEILAEVIKQEVDELPKY